jgi:putative nucleotidyltransferase with HDIG domain
MSYGITREEAFELVKQYVKSPNMINHCLAAEAVMRALAKHVGADSEKWGLAGLLHDLDAESHTDLDVHTRETARILVEKGVDTEIVEAIRLHNEQAHPGERRSTQFQHLLAAGETITGLIVATALVYPDKKLASVKPDIIRECEVAGVPLAEFCDLSLLAMQGIDSELGL